MRFLLIFTIAQKMLHKVLGNPHTNVKKRSTTVAEDVTVHKVLSDILTYIGQTGRLCPVKCNALWKKGKAMFHVGARDGHLTLILLTWRIL